ncbi:MAG: hypothetical protein B0D92_06300 [Spirochaeta sp. LUC14_002_19_P3]|nr:MAG: hypothetical protein B0D92_06300 [Spirochaeta sp. LUC14_002_19_P3]
MRKTLFILLIFSLSHITVAAQAAEEDARRKVHVIPLREDVDRYLGIFLGRALEAAREAGAETVILEIDTFGGRVDTALEITGKIGAASWAKTIAYIPSDSAGRGVSWSAGALMAFSCSEIWMAPGTSMGAASPVYQTAEGMQAAEEKTVSAVRGQMAALAEKNGYPVNIALAMVDNDITLIEVIRGDEVYLATPEEIDLMKKRGEVPETGKTVIGEDKLLTLTAGEMERYGVSKGAISTRDELIKNLGYQPNEVYVMEKSSSDSILTLLTSGAAVSILLIIGIIALYLEISSPGFGVPGAIALICFAVVFGSGGLMGNLGAVEILLFLIGLVMLILEIFIIPGFGLVGIGGILLMLIALVFSQQSFYWPQFDWQRGILLRSLSIIAVSIIGSIAAIGFIIASVPRSSLFDRLILKEPGVPGYAGHPRRKRRNFPEPDAGKTSGTAADDIVPGMKGIAVTDLRPVGKISVAGRVIVAETNGEYYDKGTSVTVLQIDGIKIMVSADKT